MPRALTEQEKFNKCEKLFEKGKNIVLMQGIKKVSIDEITKAAGMAKGSFYRYFDTKEEYILKLVSYIQKQFFLQIEQMIKIQIDLKYNAKNFFVKIFNMPELTFFIKNRNDIDELIISIPIKESSDINDIFEKILSLMKIDTQKVKSGVVINYFYILLFLINNDVIAKKHLQETFDHMIDNLVLYIFGTI